MVYTHYIASKPSTTGASCPYFVWVVISPNRNTADTLFRILQDNRDTSLRVPGGHNKGVTITPQSIERLSPKLWVVQIKEDHENMASLATAISPHTRDDVDTALKPVAGKMFLHRMESGLSSGAVPLPEVCDFDHDYISGYSFFVRRRGYPNTYWYCCGNLICLSTTKRSRFIVAIAEDSNRKHVSGTKTPMLDRDQVTIEWIDMHGSKQVGLDVNDWLTVKAKNPKTFRYSDFDGRFHMGNEGTFDHPDPSRLGTTLDVVCWSAPQVFQDSFELCYGVAPED
ncbi:hypothetical protein BJX99DRAFT_138500 [Aspergillus californicus]